MQPAASLAAALLDATSTMGRLSAAGISFNTQPSPAAVAAAIDLAAQVTAALSPYQHAVSTHIQKQAHELVKQQRRPPPQQLLVPPLCLNSLQQQHQRTQQLHQEPDGSSAAYAPLPAQAAMKDYPQLWSLGRTVVCFYAAQLLQQWEQQLLQQLRQQWGCEGSPPAAAAAAAAAAAGELNRNCGNGSSSSRPAWEEADGLLLLCAAALEGHAAAPASLQQQQQWQQQLALCRQYQQQFQQAAAKLGLSSDLMAEVAAWFTEAEQYSSSKSGAAGSAAAAAAADCLSYVCAAALMVQQIHMLVDPAYRLAVTPRSTQLTAAEELAVADFFMQVWCTSRKVLYLFHGGLHCKCTANAG
jgi:hypothetical protein